MSDTNAQVFGALAELPDATLEKYQRRLSRNTRLWLLAFVIALLAGIWIDWRWLPTSLLPLAAVMFDGWMGSLVRTETARRKAE